VQWLSSEVERTQAPAHAGQKRVLDDIEWIARELRVEPAHLQRVVEKLIDVRLLRQSVETADDEPAGGRGLCNDVSEGRHQVGLRRVLPREHRAPNISEDDDGGVREMDE
jgi:hypothetical protein